MTKNQKIEDVLRRMIFLLRYSDREDWASALSQCLNHMESDRIAANSEIISMFGGSGSLNDIILYKDGSILISESDEFNILCSKLYFLCHEKA